MGRWYEALKNQGTTENLSLQNLQNPVRDGFEGFEGSLAAPIQKISDSDGSSPEEVLRVLKGADLHIFRKTSPHEVASEDDRMMVYEERAAIMEYDGDMSRQEAEAMASTLIFGSQARAA